MALISDKIPIFKKKVASFLSKEDGKISKESLVKAGIIASVFALSARFAAGHDNGCEIECDDVPNDTRPTRAAYTSSTTSTHANGAGLEVREADGIVVGIHNHCVENCHSNHASHGSHASHCANGVCHSW